jgi:hypothetical protein
MIVDISALRRELAAALCNAQALPIPRLRFHRMLSRLLMTAFAGLDDEHLHDLESGLRVAQHALRAWRNLCEPRSTQETLRCIG